MVLADALAIGFGALIGSWLPDRAIHYGPPPRFVVRAIVGHSAIDVAMAIYAQLPILHPLRA